MAKCLETHSSDIEFHRCLLHPTDGRTAPQRQNGINDSELGCILMSPLFGRKQAEPTICGATRGSDSVVGCGARTATGNSLRQVLPGFSTGESHRGSVPQNVKIIARVWRARNIRAPPACATQMQIYKDTHAVLLAPNV